MQPSKAIARLAFVGAEVNARSRWRLGWTPTFDSRRAAGPFTTLVAFPPEPFAAELAKSVATLPALARHFCYPAGQLHVTIRNLDSADLVALLKLLDGQQQIGLRADRLRFTPHTLLLQLVAADPALRGLRARLDDLPGAHPRGMPPRRDLVFVNVLRLNGPVTAELRNAISRRRNEFAGRQLEIAALTLIRTDKVGSPERTEVLGRFCLRRRGD